MIEANPFKYYLAKYFFLAFALIQGTLATVLLIRYDFSPKIFFTAIVLVTLALIFLFFFLLVTDKIKRVAVGKNKIVVIEGDRNIRFSWPEVKSLKIIPFFNLYKLRIRGKKRSIYFFPSKNIDPAFGLIANDTSKMGSIVQKRKKEYNIR